MGLLTGGLGWAMEHGYVDYYPDVPPVYTYEYAVSDETLTGQNKNRDNFFTLTFQIEHTVPLNNSTKPLF